MYQLINKRGENILPKDFHKQLKRGLVYKTNPKFKREIVSTTNLNKGSAQRLTEIYPEIAVRLSGVDTKTREDVICCQSFRFDSQGNIVPNPRYVSYRGVLPVTDDVLAYFLDNYAIGISGNEIDKANPNLEAGTICVNPETERKDSLALKKVVATIDSIITIVDEVDSAEEVAIRRVADAFHVPGYDTDSIERVANGLRQVISKKGYTHNLEFAKTVLTALRGSVEVDQKQLDAQHILSKSSYAKVDGVHVFYCQIGAEKVELFKTDGNKALAEQKFIEYLVAEDELRKNTMSLL